MPHQQSDVPSQVSHQSQSAGQPTYVPGMPYYTAGQPDTFAQVQQVDAVSSAGSSAEASCASTPPNVAPIPTVAMLKKYSSSTAPRM
jgi:hypothetical protein